FFQAEDGIRDFHVTGVQTCALPILISPTSPSATDAYFNREAQTRLAKIEERGEHGVRVVHRMGDVGWFDGDGRLWFCGRKSHREIGRASCRGRVRGAGDGGGVEREA